PPHPDPPLFPYTTLFRSEWGIVEHDVGGLAAELEGQGLVGARDAGRDPPPDLRRAGKRDLVHPGVANERHTDFAGPRDDVDDARSEEHTSELQSRFDLVC